MSHWRRTYWSVWLANLVTSIGMMSFLPFFPSLIEEMGVDDPARVAAWSGVVFGAAPLSATLMSPIWGALGDRIGRKLMVCRAMVAIALFVGTMGLATTPLQLLLLRLGQGLFSGFVPPSITLVSVAAPADKQGRVAGDLTTALALGGMIGPMLGGLIANLTGGHRSVFAFVGVGALLSALLVWFLAEEDASKRREVAGGLSIGNVLEGVGRDLRSVWANRRMRAALALIFCLQFGLGSVNPVLELYVRDLVTGSELDSGLWRVLARFLPGLSADDPASVATFATSLLFGGMALSNLLSLPVWGRYGDRVGHARALVYCAVGSAAALYLQGAAALYVVLFSGRMLMGMSMAGTGPLAFGVAAAEVSVDRRGGAFGVVFSARTLAIAVGGTVGGLLTPWIGVRGLMLVNGTLVAVAVLAYLRAERRNGGAR